MNLPDLPPWLAALAALLLPSPLKLLKGRISMQAIISAIKTAIAIVILFVTLAEDAMGSGTGAEKKAKVIADVKSQLPGLAGGLSVPQVAINLMTNDAVLSVVVDFIVATANAAGHFSKAPEVDPQQAPAS